MYSPSEHPDFGPSTPPSPSFSSHEPRVVTQEEEDNFDIPLMTSLFYQEEDWTITFQGGREVHRRLRRYVHTLSFHFSQITLPQ
jgi:hypothetical protein